MPERLDTLTRKQLATMLQMSPKSVGINERKLGLHTARINVNPRVIRYNLRRALSALHLADGANSP